MDSEISISTIVIIVCCISLYYIYSKEHFADFEQVESKNDIMKIDQNACSKQCCNHVQWPVPFNTKNPTLNSSQESEFIPNNLSCNRGESGGCVCLTKNQFNYLSNHGQ